MKYQRIIRAVASEAWAIDHAKGRAIVEFLAFAAAGGKYPDAERAGKIGPVKDRNIRERSGGVAVVRLHGVMSQRISGIGEMSGGTSTEKVGRQIDAAIADDSVKAVILHVDSPGGNVHGTRELAAKVRGARDHKPLIAQVDSIALSAAFWVAAQATEIAITPGGDVGSIGVFTVHEDISKLLETEGIKETLVFAGEHKVEGNPFEPLSEAARAALQGRVDESFDHFLDDVAGGRGLSRKIVEADFGRGRVVSAEKALRARMVDRIATFDETLARFTRKDPNRQRRATAAAAQARS